MEDAREGAWEYSEAMCLLQAAEGAAGLEGMRRGQPRASLLQASGLQLFKHWIQLLQL